MPLTTADLTLPALRSAYAAGALTPTALCQELLPALAASRSVFINKALEEDIYERCRWAGQGWQQRTAVAATATADGLPSPARPFASSCPVPPLHASAPAGSWRRCRRSSGARCGGCPLL